MASVWVVHSGCQYEGGSAKVVCADKDTAIRFAKWYGRRYAWNKVRRRRRNGKVERERDDFRYHRRRDNPLRWDCHSDLIIVYEERIY